MNDAIIYSGVTTAKCAQQEKISKCACAVGEKS